MNDRHTTCRCHDKVWWSARGVQSGGAHSVAANRLVWLPTARASAHAHPCATPLSLPLTQQHSRLAVARDDSREPGDARRAALDAHAQAEGRARTGHWHAWT